MLVHQFGFPNTAGETFPAADNLSTDNGMATNNLQTAIDDDAVFVRLNCTTRWTTAPQTLVRANGPGTSPSTLCNEDQSRKFHTIAHNVRNTGPACSAA